jgi:uroporphyrinogen decarboxylase
MEVHMNSRQRVLTALNHQQPDRTPIDFGGHRSSGISALGYARLRQHLGLEKKPIRVYDIIQQLAVIDEDVLDLFQVDTIELGRGFALEDRDWAEWVLPNGQPCLVPAWSLPERQRGRWVLRSVSDRVIAQMPDGAFYFEQTHFPYLEAEPDLDKLPEALQESMWTAIAAPPGPVPPGPAGEQWLREGARKLRLGTERAILGLVGCNLLEMGQFLFRNDRFFMLLASEPEKAHAFLERVTEMHLENLERFFKWAGPYVDIVVFGDDLGMQTGPQISPRMYRTFFKPRHARLWRRAKELADVKVQLHSCGSLRLLLPDLIDAGLDAVNPVQISCEGMEAAGLKRDFGDQLTLWGGGCDTRAILPHGTPEEVRRHVQEQVQIFSPGGGFVFQQVHNIQADVPPENIVAMFEAVRDINA